MAEYVLREFSPEAMAQAISAEQITVAQGDGGITGYARARHDQAAPGGGCVKNPTISASLSAEIAWDAICGRIGRKPFSGRIWVRREQIWGRYR